LPYSVVQERLIGFVAHARGFLDLGAMVESEFDESVGGDWEERFG